MSGDVTFLRLVLEGLLLPTPSLLSVPADRLPGVFGELECKTFEKNREERLRGGSKGAERAQASVCRPPEHSKRGSTEMNQTYAWEFQADGPTALTCWTNQ